MFYLFSQKGKRRSAVTDFSKLHQRMVDNHVTCLLDTWITGACQRRLKRETAVEHKLAAAIDDNMDER